jgi:ParB/RepB/Spo0J family partition protein
MPIDETSTLLEIPLAHIAPSPTNPRTHKQNKAANLKAWKLEELAESIKAHGVMQPVIVRPNPAFRDGNGRPKHELVAGERRWRASQLAGKADIPALLRHLTDFEVLELQVIENIQREDLHPLEEAAGYQQLLRKADGLQGYATVDDLAARLGKSRRYVFNRLALLSLNDKARNAFLDGTINASVALVISTIPNAADQDVATARIIQGFNGEPYTARAAADYVQKEFRLTLSKAKFDIAIAYETAGPCGACPKRSGAKPDLFADSTSGDMCLDSKCFDAKTEEDHQRLLNAARDAGHTVLSADAARKLMPLAGMVATGHQFFDKPCPALTDSKKPLREIFGAGFRDVLVLDHPGSDTPVAIVTDAAVRKVLKSKGLLRTTAPTPTPPAKSTSKAPAAAPIALPPKPLTPDQVERAVDARSGALFGQRAFNTLHMAITSDAQLPIVALRILLLELLDNYVSAEGMELIYAAHGWTMPEHERNYMTDLEQRTLKASPRELANLLVEFLVCEELSTGDLLEEFDADSKSERLAKEYGIDLDALQDNADADARKEVDAEQDERTRNAEAARNKGAKPATATAAFVESAKTLPPSTGAANSGSGADNKSKPKAPLEAKNKPAAAKAAETTKPVAKYHDKLTGQTWSGRGLQPKWLQVALRNGKTLADFTVTPAAQISATAAWPFPTGARS